MLGGTGLVPPQLIGREFKRVRRVADGALRFIREQFACISYQRKTVCYGNLIVYNRGHCGGRFFMPRLSKYRSLIALGVLILILAVLLLLSDETIASKFSYKIF